MRAPPGLRVRQKFQDDPHWRDDLLFYEYFHGDNGAGIGAGHQTGWTGLVAGIIQLFGYMSPEQVLRKEARKFVYRKEGSAPPTGAGACCRITDAPAQKDGNPGGALLVPSDRAGRMRGNAYIVSLSPPRGVVMVNTLSGAGPVESGTAMASSRWPVLLLGILAVIFGVLFFIYPIPTLTLLVTFLGFYWLFNGIVALIDLFRDKTGRGWKLLVAILGILAGVLVLVYPLYSAVLIPSVLAIIIGVEGLIIGAVYTVQGFSGAGWGTGILGILSIIFGLILIANPLVAAVGLVLLLAGLAIIGGIAAIIFAFRLPG